RRPAQGAEGVGLHVPDGFLVGVPLAVGVLGRPRGGVELVGDVVVHVEDEQVRVAAVGQAGPGAVLVVALEDGVGRQGGGDHVALAGVGVDDHRDFRHTVAVDDVVGDAVEVRRGAGVLPEVGVEPAVAVAGDDVVDDGGRVGGHGGAGDLLVPRVVG